MAKHFIRKKENFICDHCGVPVIGNGYTNHCPNCLYSKHVDKDLPGDRLSFCNGLMEPIKIESIHGDFLIVHKCKKCGKIMRNKVAKEDNFERVVDISRKSRNTP